METNKQFDQLLSYHNIVKHLSERWTPYPRQIEIGKALFLNNKRRIFVCAGRRAGKSELALYMIVRWALTNPKSACYYVGPEKTQIAEVVWHSNRLRDMIPDEFITNVSKTEYRITLKNGSFIKLNGSDDADAMRGIRINFLVADEIKDWREKSFETLMPACADFNAPIFIIGTPPEREGLFTKLMEECQTDSDYAFFEMPSTENPHIDQKFIDKERKRLYDRGDGLIFEREYLARYIPGGKNKIFPQLKPSHKHDYYDMLSSTERDRTKLQYYCIADPGNTTCFAVQFIGYNPYSKQIYVFDELYVTRQEDTAVARVWPLIEHKVREICDPQKYDVEWYYHADQAAAWWRTEILDRYNVYFSPTEKHLNKKEDGISLLKDILHNDKIQFSNRCVDSYRELDSYACDEDGVIPKKDDHTIDCLRYFLAAAHYTGIDLREVRKVVDGEEILEYPDDKPVNLVDTIYLDDLM